MTAGLA